ncbi:transposase [Butyrivibrio proteoclasticus]|uniref:transposase n=1 Tax=Butyrivibrio proteoclasticus TaxID=43305 RepID=UPI00047E0B73|nr:transposase [Butyrivibrio proteoclasticus]
MPRVARLMSDSGYMHVIVRGIGRHLLFEDTHDYKHYLNRLERYCKETDVKVCAYCLMANHVHMLVHGESSSIILLMKKIGVSYSGYFNKKYDRVGHLFQDRYKSEPVEDEKYLLTVFRYILQNPEKASICATRDYPWSSYALYDRAPDFMDLSVIKDLLGDSTQYAKYIASESDEECLEYNDGKHDDEWAKEVFAKCLGKSAVTDLQTLDKRNRDEALVKLKKCGLSVRQIERLTGLGRNIVQKAGN